MKNSTASAAHDPMTEAALDWFMHRQASGHTADADFMAWLRADPAHAAAYARVEALWRDPAFAAAARHQVVPRPCRRAVAIGLRIAASAALLAVLAVGGSRIAGIPLRLPADYETAIGT
ncbi:MAG TPA: DUF4880 domain-containing protein, partial [Rhodopila sp.]|uniref:DUF4880 domain-containing protein n=1 Tax=Rhodopila sp. TaxID=2480087 RepID=UPI002BFD1289